MNTIILGMLAETSIHPGAGHDVGFVDLPVAREAATDYPVIVGSSLKGALRDRARADQMANLDAVFGGPDNAGQLIVGDGRILLLPVRSLQGAYRWITCPHLLERFLRDRARAAPGNGSRFQVPRPSQGEYLGGGEGTLYLEERQFRGGGGADALQELVAAIRSLILHCETRKRLRSQLVVLHDDDFAWFARYGLAVAARNKLDEEKKTSQNLWYEETVPPDALFYALLGAREDGALQAVRSLFDKRPYLQVGGNETVGQGWLAISFEEGGAA